MGRRVREADAKDINGLLSFSVEEKLVFLYLPRDAPEDSRGLIMTAFHAKFSASRAPVQEGSLLTPRPEGYTSPCTQCADAIRGYSGRGVSTQVKTVMSNFGSYFAF